MNNGDQADIKELERNDSFCPSPEAQADMAEAQLATTRTDPFRSQTSETSKQ